MSTDLRAKTIRLAASFPKKSPERAALLRVLAGSEDGLLLQVTGLLGQCENILHLVGTKNSTLFHKELTKEFLEKHARSMLGEIRIAMRLTPDEMRAKVSKLLTNKEVTPLTVDDPGWRAVYFLGLAIMDMHSDPRGAQGFLRRVERNISKAKM